MPCYEYQCQGTPTHKFEVTHSVDPNDTRRPQKCPMRVGDTECSAPVEKLISLGAPSFPGADSWRR